MQELEAVCNRRRIEGEFWKRCTKLQRVTVPYCCCGLLRLLTSCEYLAARLIYDNRNPGLNGPP